MSSLKLKTTLTKSLLYFQTFLAKALYDNIAETPDELAFRRGDVLTVVQVDTNGLEGWWLCSLRGKQGIAPGNRLKLLTGMSNSHNDSLYQTPPGGINRNSWETTPNQIASTVGRGLSPVHTMLDYDVPPTRHSRQNSADATSYPDSSLYDTPQKSKRGSNGLELNDLPEYDTPPTKYHGNKSASDLPHNSTMISDIYDTPLPSSKRSSIVSNISHLSNESTMTVSTSSASNKSHGKNSPSQCDSARSSMDISPHDFYDVPPSQSSVLHHHKQPSADSGLDLYDSPPKAKSVLDSMADYDVPKSDIPVAKSKSMQEKYVLENEYDVPDGRGVEHDIDDVYDVPRNNTLVRKKGDKSILGSTEPSKPKTLEVTKTDSPGVYDIPPQVTRDSVLSARSDSSESTDGQRVSGCSIESRDSDIPIYDELPLDLDAAMDLMIKLQQDVQKSTTKLSSFISSNWRKMENLEPNLYGIKTACIGFKQSLEDFLDFAQGTLANSARLPDRKLIHKLHKQLHPLQQILQLLKDSISNLDADNWQLSRLVTNDPAKSDDLGKIAGISKDIMHDIKKLVSLIHGNSSLLFRRAQSEAASKNDGTLKSSNYLKPPVQAKPTLTPEKVGIVQQRPLPPPPKSKDRPLPPTPTEGKSVNFDDRRLSEVVKRESGEFKRLSDDFRKMSLDSRLLKEESIYANKMKEEDIADEYDYVSLEAKEAEEEMKKRNEAEEKRKALLIQDDLDKQPVRDTSLRDISPLKSLNEIQDSVNSSSDAAIEPETVKTPVNRTFTMTPENSVPSMIKLDSNDKQVLVFYSGQLDTHSTLLTNAIDAFFNCIECGQGPKIFISHSKFVVVSAHKLVYIGDSLHRNLINVEVKNKIMHCANRLCDCLKMTVTATKTAALQYPSVPVVQEMVDRVVDVSHAAYELKTVISQASAL
ncbi:hypothetical protein FSP39_024574 [Pinctada imbricata]|uniref:Breast cancer anti-estrogen resistance protein 1 n=1 Tax=Pinctada imbricata TaxID=66713 RepID=A0AA89BMJ7_PINIB|nr:hypothetical protein FSP39_024574 [Pinctada imbricata]